MLTRLAVSKLRRMRNAKPQGKHESKCFRPAPQRFTGRVAASGLLWVAGVFGERAFVASGLARVGVRSAPAFLRPLRSPTGASPRATRGGSGLADWAGSHTKDDAEVLPYLYLWQRRACAKRAFVASGLARVGVRSAPAFLRPLRSPTGASPLATRGGSGLADWAGSHTKDDAEVLPYLFMATPRLRQAGFCGERACSRWSAQRSRFFAAAAQPNGSKPPRHKGRIRPCPLSEFPHQGLAH